jgi:uncharacterized Zn finger protein
MEIVTRKGEGLFPSPREITLDCSCPDCAAMCKHVAATLYGVGARLDHEPGLLFTLRGVNPTEMVEAAVDQPAGNGTARKGRVLETEELSSVFGVDIDMDGVSSGDLSTLTRQTRRTRRSAKAANAASPGAGKAGTTARRSTAKNKSVAKKARARKATTNSVLKVATPKRKPVAKKATVRTKS